MRTGINIIFAGLLLRTILAAINSFYSPLLGAEFDAIKFHETAEMVALSWDNIDLRTGWIYATALGIIYKYTFSSIFVGCLVSVFAWGISAIILNKIMDIFKIQDNSRTIILILYAFWPSAIIFTSVTLREPFQLLFLNLTIFSYVKIFLQKKTKYTFLFLGSLVCLALIHKMFVGVSFIFLLFYGFSFVLSLDKKNIKYFFYIFVILIIITSFSLDIIVDYFFSKIPLDKFSIYRIISFHINNMTFSRASYLNEEIYLYNFYDFFKYFLSSIGNYFIQPSPFRQETLFDMLLFFENTIRLILLFLAFLNLFKFMNINYKFFVIIFLAYISLEIIWALGTNNWGTAVRHHVPSMGLLFFLSFFSIKKNNFN